MYIDESQARAGRLISMADSALFSMVTGGREARCSQRATRAKATQSADSADLADGLAQGKNTGRKGKGGEGRRWRVFDDAVPVSSPGPHKPGAPASLAERRTQSPSGAH